MQQTVLSRQQVKQDIVQTDDAKQPMPVRHMQRQPIQREQIDALPSPSVIESRPIFEEPAAAISQAQGEITEPRDAFTNDATALSRLAGIPTQGQVTRQEQPRTITLADPKELIQLVSLNQVIKFEIFLFFFIIYLGLTYLKAYTLLRSQK